MKYFTISEMIKSETALKHGIWNGANLEVEENLRALVEQVLDPLREAYGKPIRVTSGYRCPKLNTLVGGSPNSQHMKGEAADIVGSPIGVGDCGSKPAMRVSGGVSPEEKKFSPKFFTYLPKTFLFLQSDEILNEAIGQECLLGINRFHYLDYPIIPYWRPKRWPSFFC